MQLKKQKVYFTYLFLFYFFVSPSPRIWIYLFATTKSSNKINEKQKNRNKNTWLKKQNKMTTSTQQRQDVGLLQGEAAYAWVYLSERKELHRFRPNLSTFCPSEGKLNSNTCHETKKKYPLYWNLVWLQLILH